MDWSSSIQSKRSSCGCGSIGDARPSLHGEGREHRERWPSERVDRLGELPQLEELVPDPRIELLGERSRHGGAADELLHVHEILATVARDHSGGQLQLDVARHGEQGEALSSY